MEGFLMKIRTLIVSGLLLVGMALSASADGKCCKGKTGWFTGQASAASSCCSSEKSQCADKKAGCCSDNKSSAGGCCQGAEADKKTGCECSGTKKAQCECSGQKSDTCKCKKG
jgi:hypothetical protein